MNEDNTSKIFVVLLFCALVMGAALIIPNYSKLVAITGYAITGTAGNGTTQVSVLNEVSIRLLDDSVNLGTLSVGNSSQPVGDYFVIENDGNTVANLTIKATDLWNSTTTCTVLPCYYYQYKPADNEAGSASYTIVGFDYSAQYNWMNATTAAGQFATAFNYLDDQDSIRVYINVTVPQDQPAGTRTSAVTFTASAAS